jgi:hypothetical protein
VAVPEPPERLAGLTASVNPVPEAERDTVPEKWFKAVIVIMDELGLTALIFTVAGLAVIV